MTVNLTDDDIATFLSDEKLTVVDFWAAWCGPCRILSPIVDEVAEELASSENISVAKINVDENSDLAVRFGIRNIPTILFIKKGEVLDRFVGVKTKEEILEKVNTLMN